MIYFATYNKKSEFRQPDYKQRKLLVIEAEKGLALERVITLVKKITTDDFDESSVEIIGHKDYDAAKISDSRVRVHKLY
jgi:hypothetical protein